MRWPGLLADRLQRPKPGRILVVGTVAALIYALLVGVALKATGLMRLLR